jgi:hypothetical protein
LSWPGGRRARRAEQALQALAHSMGGGERRAQRGVSEWRRMGSACPHPRLGQSQGAATRDKDR